MNNLGIKRSRSYKCILDGGERSKFYYVKESYQTISICANVKHDEGEYPR